MVIFTVHGVKKSTHRYSFKNDWDDHVCVYYMYMCLIDSHSDVSNCPWTVYGQISAAEAPHSNRWKPVRFILLPPPPHYLQYKVVDSFICSWQCMSVAEGYTCYYIRTRGEIVLQQVFNALSALFVSVITVGNNRWKGHLSKLQDILQLDKASQLTEWKSP